MNLLKSSLPLSYFALAIFVLGCGHPNRNGQAQNDTPDKASAPMPGLQDRLVFARPESNEVRTIGEDIEIALEPIEGAEWMDSVRILVDGQKLVTLDTLPYNFKWSTAGWMPGSRKIQAEIYRSGTLTGRNSISVALYSDVIPAVEKCRVLKKYPHDPDAYTQGLIFDQGFLYESTGVRGKSSLRKLDLETGNLLASLNLPPDLFGEGICAFNNKIIQLTWTSGYGFIYDKNSFRLLRKINYGTQGWGITFDGHALIMSNGTHQLIYMDTAYFKEIRRIEVYDDQGPVRNLNELEYINGLVFANIYTTDRIAIIDPRTGKVSRYIDCSGLLEEKERREDTDVLNGIAYDEVSHRLFITGKNWPRLFEIETIDQ
jgi:glutamine cyclotransferase